MRVSKEQAAENRKRVVTSAARLFRAHGYDGVGVDAIMEAAGLTHGGFYKHFRSKGALAVEALEQAFGETLEAQRALGDLDAYVAAYLSPGFRADVAQGCAMTAMGADAARREELRVPMGDNVRAQIGLLDGLLPEADPQARRTHALRILASLVGAVVLARAVDDGDLGEEIVEAVRGERAPTGR